MQSLYKNHALDQQMQYSNNISVKQLVSHNYMYISLQHHLCQKFQCLLNVYHKPVAVTGTALSGFRKVEPILLIYNFKFTMIPVQHL